MEFQHYLAVALYLAWKSRPAIVCELKHLQVTFDILDE